MKLTAESTVFNDNAVQNKFAELTVDADGIRTEVGKKVGNDEVISRINQSAESVSIDADKVNIRGVITAINDDTTTTIDGDKITTGTLSASAVNANSGTFNTANIPNLSADKIDVLTKDGTSGIYLHPSNQSPTSLAPGNSVKIDDTGMKVYKGGTQLASYGTDIILGQESTRHAKVSSGGLEVFSDTNNSVGLLGYGSGKDSSGTMSDAPYFTLGTRNAGSTLGNYSHASGIGNEASGYASHAEGFSTIASGYTSHAEGSGTDATGTASHAEGELTTASGMYSHAGGSFTIASGKCSHAEGQTTIARGECSYVIGKFNRDSTSSFVVGNGSSLTAQSDALVLKANGNLTIAGTLTQSSDRRLKDHVAYLGNDADEFIRNLKPAHFRKDEADHLGFYAQDVESADTWHCMTSEMNGFKTLGYTEIIAPLVAYCQHLEKRIEELEKER